jgi:hypothetical protein
MDRIVLTYIWTPSAPITTIQTSPAIVQAPTFPKLFRVIQFSQRIINECVKNHIFLHVQELESQNRGWKKERGKGNKLNPKSTGRFASSPQAQWFGGRFRRWPGSLSKSESVKGADGKEADQFTPSTHSSLCLLLSLSSTWSDSFNHSLQVLSEVSTFVDTTSATTRLCL